MSDHVNAKLAEDCLLAAECLKETGTFEIGQAILKDAAARIRELEAQVEKLYRDLRIARDEEEEAMARAERLEDGF